MERIEVLRGPQGTLFGRNSTGGVVNLITAKPNFDAFSGSAKLNYGKDNEKQVNVVLNVPISDSLAARFANLAASESLIGTLSTTLTCFSLSLP